MSQDYKNEALSLEQVQRLPGSVLLDFGTNWCGHCNATRPHTDAALAAAPEIRHIRIEDGKGRPLGRAFGVTLWPTLVFLHQGRTLAKLVRPQSQREIEQALQQLQEQDR